MPGAFISTNMSEYFFGNVDLVDQFVCISYIVYMNVYYIYMVYQMQVIQSRRLNEVGILLPAVGLGTSSVPGWRRCLAAQRVRASRVLGGLLGNIPRNQRACLVDVLHINHKLLYNL